MSVGRVVDWLGNWCLLFQTIGSLFVILGIGLLIVILWDVLIYWHTPVWPFASASDFFQLVRLISAIGFVIGLFGVMCAYNEQQR